MEPDWLNMGLKPPSTRVARKVKMKMKMQMKTKMKMKMKMKM